MSTTPNMNLDLPVVSTTPGPEWAQDLNDALDIVDEHDHTSGKGVKVPVAGLNIDGNLSMQVHSLIQILASVYNNQSADPADLRSIYVKGGELFYKDAAGNAVQITSGGSINGPYGSIGGLVSPATATYSAVNKDFTFNYDASKPARLNIGDIRLYPFDGASVYSNYVTIKVPTSLASQTTVTMPTYTGTIGLDFGAVPVGGVVPIFSNFSGSFSIPPSGTVQNGWQLCDGAPVPGGNTIVAPGGICDLSSDVFIMGDTFATTTHGGLNSRAPAGSIVTTGSGTLGLPHQHDLQNHTHSMTHTHDMANHTHNMDHVHGWGNTDATHLNTFFNRGGSHANNATDQLFGPSATGASTAASLITGTNQNLYTGYAVDISGAGDQVANTGTPSNNTTGGSSAGTTGGPSPNASDITSPTVTFASGTYTSNFTGASGDIRPRYLSAQYVMRVK